MSAKSTIPGRLILLLAGFGGFSIVFFCSIAAGSDATYALRDASFGCIIASLLAKLFLNVLGGAIQQAPNRPSEKSEVPEGSDDKPAGIPSQAA